MLAANSPIVRELIDGSVGFLDGNENLPDGSAEWWADYRARVEQAASSFKLDET